MSNQCYKPVKLPEISMIGGDCTDWEFTLIRKNGSTFYIEQGVECTATLTVVPFDSVASPAGYINTQEIILQKTATFSETSSGGTAAVFEFEEADTKELYGKFIYQVEVHHGDDVRIGQGDLCIQYNINQEVAAE